MLRFIYVCTQNAVRYAIIESVPFDGTSFFYISPEGGQVSVVRPLTETTQDSFTVSPAPVPFIALSVLLQSCSSLCLFCSSPAHRFVCSAPVLLIALSVLLQSCSSLCLFCSSPAHRFVCSAPVLLIALSVLLQSCSSLCLFCSSPAHRFVCSAHRFVCPAPVLLIALSVLLFRRAAFSVLQH